MNTITISKKEYQDMVEKSFRYECLAKIVKEKKDIFASPPTHNVNEVIESFCATKLYNKAFLTDLEKGLKRSSYFKGK